MTAGLTLMKSVLTPLAKSVLMSLGLTATMSATDTVIQKKTDKSGRPSESASCKTALVISNGEMANVMKIPKSLEKSRFLIKQIRETMKNEAEKQKGGFLPMVYGH